MPPIVLREDEIGREKRENQYEEIKQQWEGTAENGDRGESVEETSEKQKLLHVLGNVLSILGSASKMQTSSSQIIWNILHADLLRERINSRWYFITPLKLFYSDDYLGNKMRIIGKK